MVESLKGTAQGSVTVEQQGGFNKDGQLVLVENDKLVEYGQTYLFATRKSDRGSYVAIPVYGDVGLGPDPIPALNAMRKAITEQIPFL